MTQTSKNRIKVLILILINAIVSRAQRIKVYANIIILVQNGVNGIICHKYYFYYQKIMWGWFIHQGANSQDSYMVVM